ncbi:MAG: SixA phosphatase family protein [Pseudorhodobacter sp.]
MTKRLILTRHAKSSWSDPLISDHERPLNERGRGAAEDLGAWLVSRGYLPDEVLCSDALRTRETWEGVAGTMPDAPAPILKPTLYHAGAEVMLAVLGHGTGDTVMMVGHNPGIAEFAQRILRRPSANPDFNRYPTGATLVAEFAIGDWALAEWGSAVALDFVVPRESAS